MQEPALEGSSRGAELSGEEIRELRRWLWERFNVSQSRRANAPRVLSERWAGDEIACVRTLRAALVRLVQSGELSADDALAWGKLASLEGRRVARRKIEAQVGISSRGLDRRLEVTDRKLADLLSKGPNWASHRVPAPEVHQPALSILLEAAIAYGEGLVDSADGYYSAAADVEGLLVKYRRKPTGKDRTVRRRTRLRALAGANGGVYRAGAVLMEPPARMSALASPGFVLSDDPDETMDSLEAAWREGRSEPLPLLLDRSLELVNADGPGSWRRQRLLEIGSNVLRDSESLLALPWTMRWAEENRGRPDVASLRGEVQGRKTTAHILQLHGFLEAAGTELDHASEMFKEISPNSIGDFDLLKADLILRRAAVRMLAGDSRAALDELHQLHLGSMPDRMRLTTARYLLHAETFWLAGTRERRSFVGRRTLRYEAALTKLVELLSDAPASARFTVLDTIIASAIRVGDVQTIKDAVESMDWSPTPVAANVLYRLHGRLNEAAKLPGLSSLSTIPLRVASDPLRERVVPERLKFLL